MGSENPEDLRLGVHHIVDLRGDERILFVAALIAAYQPANGKRLRRLIGPFALGHSVTCGARHPRSRDNLAPMVEIGIARDDDGGALARRGARRTGNKMGY
jgi:hypothetical protein